MVVVQPRSSSTMVIANHMTLLDDAIKSVVSASPMDLTLDTLRPSSRLVVGRRGSAGLIGVVVAHGFDRLRFAAAAIPDRVGRYRVTRVVVGGFVELIGVIVTHGVERFRFACVVGGFGFVGWVQESFGSVVVVDAGLAGVQRRGRGPFDFAAGVDAGGPATVLVDHPVVGSAGQAEFVDVGVAAVDPIGHHVMHL